VCSDRDICRTVSKTIFIVPDVCLPLTSLGSWTQTHVTFRTQYLWGRLYKEIYIPGHILCDYEAIDYLRSRHLGHSLRQWYSTFLIRVPPDIISLQLCTPKVVSV
jgi:hypothetical protein